MKNIIKKELLQKGKCLIVLVAMMLVVAGCGNSEDVLEEKNIATSTPIPTQESIVENQKVSEEKDEVITTDVPVPTEEPIIEEVVEDTFNGIEISDSMTRTGLDFYDSRDQINVYSVTTEGNMPYYVGRDNEEATNFMKNNKTSKDGFIYLGLPMYLPDEVKKGTVYVAVSDETVAKIEGNDLIGLKQGVFTLSSYDSEKNLIEEKKYVCTTFNDSKGNKESFMTISASQGTHTSIFANARDIEYWKDSVHTIMDMCYMLQARHFKYDFNKEPEFGVIEGFAEDEKRWTWVQSPETIFEMSGGVCIQVAQLATYMLAGDYEDWGVIYVEGMQGHVFNWFYEDGSYYIFDFTQVISDNAWNRDPSNSDSYYGYWDYSNQVKIFQTVEEIQEWCINEKVNKDENYLIYMISCLGHDYLPCSMNSGMSSSVDCLRGTFNGGTISMGFQDVVFEKLKVLYHKPGSVDINFITLTAEEINDSIPYGVYGDTEEFEYRFNY